MRLLLLILSSVVTTSMLHATTIVPAGFREVVAGSQVIVYGRVTDTRAVLVDGRRRIDTIVTLDVGSYFKGGPGETETFRVPGGTVGRYRSIMVGAPEFRAGEEVVLFLHAAGPSIPQVFGLAQGVYRVRVDEQSGNKVVIPPVMIARGETAEVITRGAPERRPLALDQFGAQVRAVMQAGAR